jgi:putative ABC transport system substrate-binding protein
MGGAAVYRSVTAHAQERQPPLIGMLEASSADFSTRNYQGFREELRKLGYVEGRNIRFEYRFAAGALERLPELAAELVELKPSVIESLSRPGGNVTGLTNFAEQLAAKQLDVIRELVPTASRLGVLVNVVNPLHVPQWRETEAAATKASLTLVRFDFRAPSDLEPAFEEFERRKVEVLLVPPDITFATHRARIAQLAAKARLPAIYPSRLFIESGGLLGYGSNPADNYRRAAVFVERS